MTPDEPDEPAKGRRRERLTRFFKNRAGPSSPASSLAIQSISNSRSGAASTLQQSATPPSSSSNQQILSSARSASRSPKRPPSDKLPLSSHKSASQDLLDKALAKLSDEEHELLKEYFPDIGDVDKVVNAVLAAAEEKKRICIDQQWSYHAFGKTFSLRETAEKVTRLLSRFASVGDIVANVDPIHLGLPSAGIRMLIIVSTRT